MLSYMIKSLLSQKKSVFDRVSSRKYESLQIQSTTVFPSRSTLGMIETIPQIGKALEKFAPNAILILIKLLNGYVTNSVSA